MNQEEKELSLALIKKTLSDRGIKQTWVANQLDVASSTLTLYLQGKGRMGAEKVNKLEEIVRGILK